MQEIRVAEIAFQSRSLADIIKDVMIMQHCSQVDCGRCTVTDRICKKMWLSGIPRVYKRRQAGCLVSAV